jgi:hypothetical protein
MTSAYDSSAGKPGIVRLQTDVRLSQARFKGIGCDLWTVSYWFRIGFNRQAVVSKVTLEAKPSNTPAWSTALLAVLSEYKFTALACLFGQWMCPRSRFLVAKVFRQTLEVEHFWWTWQGNEERLPCVLQQLSSEGGTVYAWFMFVLFAAWQH